MEFFTTTEFKLAADTGVITGYGAIFNNIDMGNDRILPGAFSKTLAGKTSIPMLFSHDQARPIGVWDKLRQDGRGLIVRGKISDTADGRDIRTLAKDGAVTGLSIGYMPNDFGYDSDGVRTLKSVDLHEVSLVTFPMNELARISAVKSALGRGEDPGEDDFAALLRNAGLSRRLTKRLMQHGYAGLSKNHQLVEVLNNLSARLEE